MKHILVFNVFDKNDYIRAEKLIQPFTKFIWWWKKNYNIKKKIICYFLWKKQRKQVNISRNWEYNYCHKSLNMVVVFYQVGLAERSQPRGCGFVIWLIKLVPIIRLYLENWCWRCFCFLLCLPAIHYYIGLCLCFIFLEQKRDKWIFQRLPSDIYDKKGFKNISVNAYFQLPRVK